MESVKNLEGDISTETAAHLSAILGPEMDEQLKVRVPRMGATGESGELETDSLLFLLNVYAQRCGT